MNFGYKLTMHLIFYSFLKSQSRFGYLFWLILSHHDHLNDSFVDVIYLKISNTKYAVYAFNSISEYNILQD